MIQSQCPKYSSYAVRSTLIMHLIGVPMEELEVIITVLARNNHPQCMTPDCALLYFLHVFYMAIFWWVSLLKSMSSS